MNPWKEYCLDVEGPYACFTRPELKVERVSYDVITPSASRAIFEAIFWKPAVRWRVRRIEVLQPIRWTSVRRNEVGAVASPSSDGIFIEEARQQRAGLFLRDVRYRLHAQLEFLPPAGGAAQDENPGKYQAMFERRARKGQCFNQPYLGCREFSCSVRLVESLEAEPAPIQEDRDLGYMLYDLDFAHTKGPSPAFFRASMRQGVIDIPPWDSEEVRK